MNTDAAETSVAISWHYREYRIQSEAVCQKLENISDKNNKFIQETGCTFKSISKNRLRITLCSHIDTEEWDKENKASTTIEGGCDLASRLQFPFILVLTIIMHAQA